MSVLTVLLAAAEETEERTNITPVLIKFGLKFLAIFAIVAVVTVLTPRMAKRVDALREKHRKPEQPEDPRCKAVKGPYDMPEPVKKDNGAQAAHDEAPARRHRKRRPPQEGARYRPKHAKPRRKRPEKDEVSLHGDDS
ncbi:MAG: hypothetical protein IKQ39_06745 [Oscillospiraceae bacterium]|nr:hypothetical protein [Oscillospiraceae bacterium]